MKRPGFVRKRPRLQFALTAIVFILGGIDGLDNSDASLAVANFIVAFFNLAGAVLVVRLRHHTNIGLFILNAIFAAYVSYHMHMAGKHRLPYAWAFISLISIASIFRYWWRIKRKSGDAAGQESTRT